MADLSASRQSPRLVGDEFEYDVLASQTIWNGSMVFLTAAGYATPTTAVGLRCVGVAQKKADNSAGASGDIRVKVMPGVYEFHNSASSDEITIADLEKVCFVVDNQTVAKTDSAGTRAVAGIVKSIAPDGKVRVELGERKAPAQGAEDFSVEFEKISSKAADAEVARWVAPFACKLLSVQTVLNGALATGDATVQAKVGASNAGSTTTGLVTITQAASAAGDIDEALPVTTNVDVAKGAIVSLTVGGASTATATFNATLKFSKSF